MDQNQIPTPRTDAERQIWGYDYLWVRVIFARQLERELAAERARITELEAANKRIREDRDNERAAHVRTGDLLTLEKANHLITQNQLSLLKADYEEKLKTAGNHIARLHHDLDQAKSDLTRFGNREDLGRANW